jgi:S-adenosylmethionine:tRNA ribosyltransferase-isomerase
MMTLQNSNLDPNLQASYDYDLPQSLIASSPIEPRDHAKLLVYDRRSKKLTHARFDKLLSFLPPDCAVLLNDTKVIKARIFGHKISGGKIELLLNSPLKENYFSAYVRGKVHPGVRLIFPNNLEAKVEELREEGLRIVSFTCKQKPINASTLYEILDSIGHIPLPPYIKREDNAQDSHDYQSVFASNPGAVAAPTASLHFTPKLLNALKSTHSWAHLTLHVGAGTFKPVEVSNINEHTMHSERFTISSNAKSLIDSPKSILAVGTTVTRTVEYYARTGVLQGECNLFLHPNNPPVRINHLLTNFHLPKSTLIMLVASFVGLEKTLELYKEAVEKEYRFFSYGDGMLIL